MRGRAAIITAFNPYTFQGGIETYSSQLEGLLRGQNVACDFYYIGEQEEGHGFHNDYLGRLYRLGRKVFERDRDYDFIIANAFYGLGYFPPRVRTFNIFHLTHMGFAEEIRDVVPAPQYLEWKFLWGKLSESVSGFERSKIAVSESVRDELNTYYGFEDVKVVPSGIDTRIFAKADKLLSRKRYAIPEDAFVGLYVGRWNILKGCDVLEEVMAGSPDVFWLLALGTGSDKAPVGERVRVIEQIPHEGMKDLYSAADFMIFLSRYEGFGYVIIEAMACGLPVIVTNVGIAKTVYKDEPFREFLLPPFSAGRSCVVSSAMDRIAQVRSGEDIVHAMTREGRTLIEKEFGIERWKKQMVAIFGL
ncbi:putative Glycosyl transferase group 1 [Candidatus Sulfobium mesophilum]|uniref:Putative Glycosyl transferase group 1 n=1 Tax=Candidatus Sulfobium mesophilum TaxID=2016548 RepID=A0A2U3QFP9_9BACT|nr:putative Glycosyl transferase group 1 [Candidatus Sulfobium mesophilum]